MSRSNKTKHAENVELLKEWAKLHDTITTKQDEIDYYSPPKTRLGAAPRKSDTVTGIQRHSSEEDEDCFAQLYLNHGLIEPVFPFHQLWRLREESDTLTSCIQSMVNNCALLNEFEFLGDDKAEKDLDENQSVLKSLRSFFSRVNEKESFLTLRKKIHDDEETTGNAFVEVIRNAKGYPERLYYSPSTHMRITRLDDYETKIDVTIPRDGKMITIPWTSRDAWGRAFRRFARVNTTSNVISWFKEFGDPRIVDATTGEYVKDSGGKFIREPAEYPNKATEIWWFRHAKAGEPYGLPRWISALHNVVGRYIAQWVNRDHLDQGAIPPFMIIPKNGTFTKQQVEAIRKILEDWRKPGVYNQPIFMDIKANTAFSPDRGISKLQTEVEIIKLRDPKDEDYMFSNYLAATEESIRKIFLLPPLYIGSASDYSNAVSYTSIEIAENQVFDPVKLAFDEKITTELIQHEFGVYNWKFKTKPSKINDREVFYRAVNVLSRINLSINQATELANSMFNTDFSTHKGALYNEPLSLVSRVVSPTTAKLTEDGFEFINPEPQAPIPFGGETPEQQPEDQTPSLTVVKEDSTVEDDQQELLAILSRIEERGYQAPDITEAHYEL